MLLINTNEQFSSFSADDYTISKYIERRGFMYIMKDELFPDAIKIGRTTDLVKRLSFCNANRPHNTAKVYAISKPFVNVHVVEQQILLNIYEEFSAISTHKEWFHLDALPLCEMLITEAENHFPLLV